MTNAVLVLNAGSSSIKFAVYPDEEDATPMLRGKVAGIGNNPVMEASDANGHVLVKHDLMQLAPSATHDEIIPRLLNWLNDRQDGVTIIAAGHRVVHGGQSHSGPARITETLLHELDDLARLAPLHQPHNLVAIRCVAAESAGLPQIACFDTSFHRTQNKLAQLFALPRALSEEGIIRYGFHGLSYDYIASSLPAYLGDRANGRVIVAHLGNGASMCALKSCRSEATSMGFTALDGLMMGRRCGTLDPGVVLYLLEQKTMSATEITQMLYKQSGLLGVSGISNNMAVLEASHAAAAREAIELYCYRAAGEVASLTTSIGGLDALVFTAGIGENSALIRRLIVERLAWMGIALDDGANKENSLHISTANSAVEVLVIPTNEELVIARAVRHLC